MGELWWWTHGFTIKKKIDYLTENDQTKDARFLFLLITGECMILQFDKKIIIWQKKKD